MKEKSRVQRTDPEVVRAYLRTEMGRTALRRELVECAQVKRGQRALLLCDTQRLEGIDEVAELAAGLLRDLGVQVVVMQVDELIPVMSGAMAGSFAHVEKHKLPKIVFEAARAADIVFDYTTNSRGAQKFTLDFYTLSNYYGKPIVAGRTLEAPEVLGESASAPIHNLEALLYPSDLLRVIGDRVNEMLYDAAEAKKEFRLTNPWGADLRFTSLPGDISQPAGGIRKYPSEDVFRTAETNRLYRALAGFSVPQSFEGVWVTKYCTLVGGELSEPMRVTLKGGFIERAEGGPEADRLMKLMEDDKSGVHALLIGIHPKVAPFRNGRYMLGNNGAGMGVAHLALGGPGLFYRNGEWGPVGNKHFQLGNIPKISLSAGSRHVWKDGVLEFLSDPAMRQAARKFGDPDELLRSFDWAQGQL
jgi:hypothetical protein